MTPHETPDDVALDSASRTVIEQFEKQADAKPEAIAIVFEDRTYSFRQLDELANRFANALHRCGVKRGETVGLCIDRRPEAIASMLGAFKIGAVYVPLDPEYPADRVRYMIKDAALHVIITHDRVTNTLASELFALDDCEEDSSRKLHWIDSASESFASEAIVPIHDLPAPDELAYIMYTSGSTGMPKGVQIEHRALAVYCDADRQIFDLTSADRTLQFSTLNFDIAIEEIFPPLLTGGTVVIRPRYRSSSGNELSAIIDRHQVTAIHLATAYWHEWVDLMIASKTIVPASLRLVIATGEKVSVEHYRRWNSICRQDVKWCNAYGPTETTVTATVFIPEKDFCADNMPIGKPLAGYDAYILDDALRPLGVGETGQLFIGGLALARGYHNNPEKTNAAFLTVDLPDKGPTRIYRTGDLARWLPSGDVEFAGRVDHQIKVGSYRIEPGEIEVAIAKFPQVLESIVIHEEVAGQKFLIAYVAVGVAEIEPKQLQEFLRTMLPVYMIPPRYVFMPALPKTINGKIDRRSLPSADTSMPVTADESVAPLSDIERKLQAIWQSVLHYPSVGRHDDFFALGGSSLLVTRIVASVASEFGVELPVRDVFANPTIASCASHISRLVAHREGVADVADGSFESTRHSQRIRERLPHVSAGMIDSGDGQLFSVLYQPRTPRRNQGVLICNTIGHEQVRAYRNLQQLALQLADAGFDVLRFDYRGTGNSSGDCASCLVESCRVDTRNAARFLRNKTSVDALGIVGIRLGATIAATADVERVERIVLWDPVIIGANFVNLLDRLHDEALLSQNRFNRRLKRVDGNEAYGHSLAAAKRKSIDQTFFPKCAGTFDKNNLVLCSHGYQDREIGMELLEATWHLKDTEDHIHWHDPKHTEHAFSSPSTYKAIGAYLADWAPNLNVNKTSTNDRIGKRTVPFANLALPIDLMGELLS